MPVILVALFFLVALPAHSAVSDFDYRLTEFPDNENDCAKTAKKTADILSGTTGVQIKETHQQAVRARHTCNITITYTAAARLALISTYLTDASPVMPIRQGSYRTLEECNQALFAEKQLFEKMTTLQAVAAYCMKEPVNSAVGPPSTPYLPRIDAFGKPKLFPLLFMANLRNPFSGDGAAAAQIEKLLKASNVNVARVAVPRGMGGMMPEVLVRYYRESKLPLSLWEVSVESDALCRALIPSMNGLFAKVGEPALYTYCASGDINSTWRTLTVLRVENPLAHIRRYPAPFDSYSNCAKAGPEVATYFKNIGAMQGGVCSIANDGTQMWAFLKTATALPRPVPIE